MSEKPHRRWFQFGLRTMFVAVAALALLSWLWSEWRFVQSRNAALRTQILGRSWRGPERLPIWRLWLGDTPYHQIEIDADAADKELASIRDLFPEANVTRAQGPFRTNARGEVPSSSPLDPAPIPDGATPKP